MHCIFNISTKIHAYRYLLRDCIKPSMSLASNLHIEVALDMMESISCRELRVAWVCGLEYVTSGNGKTSAPNSEKAFNHRKRLDSSVVAN